MKFSDSFYEEINNRLSDELLNFWGKRNLLHFALNMNLEQFIKWSIDSIFDKIDEDKLADDIPKIRDAYRKKRRDWSKRYHDLLKLPYTDKLHPLYSDYLNLKKASPTELILQYQDLPIEEILQLETEKMNDKVEKWKKSKTMPLISFPSLDILSETMIENALKDDIVKVTCDYIVKELKYNFEAEARLLPSPIIDKPLFGINSVYIPLEEINGTIQSVIQNQNNGSTLTMIPNSNSVNRMKSLNKKDLAVYEEITKLAITSGISQQGKIMVEINPYSIAANIWGYQVNSKDALSVLDSIDKFANRRFIYTNQDGQSIDYVLIDTIIKNEKLYEDGVPHPYILLGYTISEAISQKDIIGVSKKLENKVVRNGKIFLHALQAKRFETFRDNPKEMTANLNLHFFEKSTFFSTKSYKKKIAIVTDCLDSYVSRDILIKDYVFQNDIFTLTFITLDEDDMKYYSNWLINHQA